MFIVHMKDGTTLKESDGVNWKTINTQNIRSLQLVRNGRLFTVSVSGEKAKLLQLKRQMINTLLGTDALVERVIGFIYKDIAVKMVVDEATGNVTLTCEEQIDEKNKKVWRKV